MNNKQEIKSSLRQCYGDVIYTLSDLDDTTFFAPRPGEKWSPAEILGHLILSSKAINKAMSAPKMFLRASFGISKEESSRFDEKIAKYHSALSSGLKAPKGFVYKDVEVKGRDNLMSSWSSELSKLLVSIEKWSEKDLDKYQLPHPAFGKLSVRDMLKFTDFHTQHHHEQIKEVLVTT